MSGYTPQLIRTDEDGVLARDTDFCALLLKDYNITLQTTGGYSSWINGKAEKHIQTIVNMMRSMLYDSG